MRSSTLFAILACASLAQLATSVDVRAIFFDDKGQDGDPHAYTIAVQNGTCTSCQGFGVLTLIHSYESYALLAPTYYGRTYSLVVFDGDNCEKSNDYAALPDMWGDFPGTLPNSVDSWKVCAPGAYV
jgi:hypothetical protein